MMDRMMNGGHMWGMSVLWLLIVALLVLGVPALVKYLFFDNKR
jgi:cytochrome c oxidase assembly factor CtaG